MDSQRNLLIIALLFVSFMIWQAWEQDKNPQPQQQTESEPKARRLDLVRSAPEKPQDTPPSPLKGLFERLAELDTHKTGVTKAADDAAAVDPMHMPLADLFELLESQGGRQ